MLRASSDLPWIGDIGTDTQKPPPVNFLTAAVLLALKHSSCEP